MVILGIDPGSHYTGFGILRVDGRQIQHLTHGVLTPPGHAPFLQRLHYISENLQKIFELYRPDVTVVERIFLGKNADSAFKLGHVRGICLLGAAQCRSQVVEYAARSVKKGVTGSGASSKEQVQMILFSLLRLPLPASVDASDALALAYYHIRQMEIAALMKRQETMR